MSPSISMVTIRPWSDGLLSKQFPASSLLKMSGRSRKRKQSSRQSRRAVQLNSGYYLLSSQDGPGSSISHHTDLQDQLRADPLFLLRGDVLLSDDEDLRWSKRSRPIESTLPTNGRRSPQPGTSRDLYAHSELQQRARSPSPPRAAIPIATISDGEDTALPSVARANTPPIIMSDDDDDDDENEQENVIFVGMLRPPQVELDFFLARQLDIIEANNRLPMNVTYDLPTMIFSAECANGKSDCGICLSDYVEGEQLMTLPCNHNFHRSCVSRWLQQSPTCPVCRTQIH
ncbi:hypothetical protein AALO_G00125110 [Alosa alosa]|uniref:RING-type domain-containing protein n=1 Tax=Alosa alosa TaxID=278164 RepID=A0AAV6GPJ4_9TELE|nr:hypothetical protein AALO_G00125110 [Alosa alosa]